MIDGTYDLLYLDFGYGFFPIGCLTSNDFSENVETLETTTRDNKGWKTYTLTNQGYQINFSGISVDTLFTDEDPLKYSYDILKVYKRSRTLLKWKIENSIHNSIETGQAQIIDLSKSSNVDEFITFSGTLMGYGKPQIETKTGLEQLIEKLL